MFSLFLKPKPWIAALLLAAATVFGVGGAKASSKESCKTCGHPCEKPACPQPTPPTHVCPKEPAPCCPAWPTPVLNAAYNYPARTLTRCPCEVDLFASFIYWQPVAEYTDVAAVYDAANSGTVARMDNEYKPGFQVGIGYSFGYDNWDLQGQYTWLHGTNHGEATAEAGGYVVPAFDGAFTTSSQSWRLKMDIAEVDLGRWHYTGTQFTCRPNLGLRAAWIRQRLENTATGAVDHETVTAQYVSWALGPKAGIDTNWMIWQGLRLFGNGEVDVLYTRYNKVSTSRSGAVAGDPTLPNSLTEKSFGLLRTHLDLEMGLGWGMYFDCNKWYLDFTAGYGFQVFFNQNMSTFMFDNFGSTWIPNSNLYVQGMTLKARLDF